MSGKLAIALLLITVHYMLEMAVEKSVKHTWTVAEKLALDVVPIIFVILFVAL